ncbi:rRNA small subunit 7-methylguanosine (m7G) methyltransferase GidB [Thermodesulfovibrio sp. N1]|uniref:16S rRNA (guanine(527)-N(7))-methyltransferase RsmG n=1 Tax=unclassified Thermodesulfovibrio TaxID=2645936 RepID=UPI00083A2F49|nr:MULTISPECIES: 16S rRNA (guanine(527)-N(7))-methyltransferase RsmG [unclassified Thermodesulfovibrio]MDI1471243.1 16S rRNA (guanine(527)-N(7))-methyltransferase RsmG [Thermodesulfovibrio sp. 1176]ODA43963.1 rRNA small subunit 7-methylguanosine (m7G) methyltransferase GidB [Thermodesulfovibrio sp. N1]
MSDLKDFMKLHLKLSNEAVYDKFLIYLTELKKWNKTYNLTSIEDEKEIIVKHFLDSLLYLSFIPEKSLNIADIGSGAGFPGVPIAIVREDLKILLIEPSWKKCVFLKNIKRKLELPNIEVYQMKAEEVEKKFDIVVSRALWSMKEFIEKCKHLLKENGYFLISKSLKLQEELKELPQKYKVQIKEFDLPLINGKRYIIRIEKCES